MVINTAPRQIRAAFSIAGAGRRLSPAHNFQDSGLNLSPPFQNPSKKPSEKSKEVKIQKEYKGHIALFVGNDVTAHLIANYVVPRMIQLDYKPVLFLPTPTPSPKPEAHHEICRDFDFFQRDLLNKVVYPYLNKCGPLVDEKERFIEGLNYSPQQLAEYYGIKVVEVPDVNDPAFINELVTDEIAGAISIRCYQRFRQPIIDAMSKQEAFFWNLHPGQLPSYRGLFSPLYAIAAGEKSFGWTLHQIDQGLDTGPVIDIHWKPIIPGASAINLYFNFGEEGGRMIMEAISMWDHNFERDFRAGPQNEAQAHYYSYPKNSDYRKWKKKGLQYFDPDEIIDFYMEKFTVENSQRHDYRLFNELEAAVENWRRIKMFNKDRSHGSQVKIEGAALPPEPLPPANG